LLLGDLGDRDAHDLDELVQGGDLGAVHGWDSMAILGRWLGCGGTLVPCYPSSINGVGT
jgi:hypothetical protein